MRTSRIFIAIIPPLLAGCSLGLTPAVGSLDETGILDRPRDEDTATDSDDSDDSAPDPDSGRSNDDDDDDDGYDGRRPPQFGDLVISELLIQPKNSMDPAGEWFEVKNTTPDMLDLMGLTIRDDSGESIEIDPSHEISLPPNAYGTICNTTDTEVNGGVDCIWGWESAGAGTFRLRTESDVIALGINGVELDRVAYQGAWNFTEGTAKGLKTSMLDPSQNDDQSAWCNQISTFGSGDYGTPGTANDAC